MAKKILVADDDPGIQDIFKIILESAGYTVEIISNGEDILRDNYTVPNLFFYLTNVYPVLMALIFAAISKTRNLPRKSRLS